MDRVKQIARWRGAVLGAAGALVLGVALVPGVRAAGPNLVVNPGVDDATTCYTSGGWGTGTAGFARSPDGHTAPGSLSVTLSGRTSGDSKWLVAENDTCAPAVAAGSAYDVSVWVKSTSPAIALTLFAKSSAGWTYWTDVAWGGSTGGAWQQLSGRTPAVPAGTTRVAFGVSIAADGTLLTDDYALNDPAAPATTTTAAPATTTTTTRGTTTTTRPTTTTTRPTTTTTRPTTTTTRPTTTRPTTTTTSTRPTTTTTVPTTTTTVPTTTTTTTTTAPPGELVVNGGLESGGIPPDCMIMAGWGDGAVTSGYTTDAHTGRAWQLTMTGRTQGDAKLLLSDAAGCAPSVTVGATYDISVWYRSTAPVNGLTLFTQTASGWGYWTDLRTLPASAGWTQVTATTPPIPAGVARLSFGVSLVSDGVLATDDLSLRLTGAGGTTTSTTTTTTTTTAGNPATDGRWTLAAQPLPNRTIHSTLLRDGRILLIAGSGNSGEIFAAGAFTAAVWDPVTGTMTNLTVPKDMFCAGHATLPDGRVLIMGGTKSFPGLGNTDTNFAGLADSWVFDPSSLQFTKLNDAQTGHWYPTLTKLGNGDIWAAGGLDEHTNGTVATELFSSSGLRWLTNPEVPQTWSYWGTYPHMWLLADGRLFYDGVHTFGLNRPGTGASFYDWRTATITDVPGLRDKDLRDQAGSALLPPAQDQRVAVFGGGNTEANATAIAKVDVIDLRVPNPQYHAAPDLPGPGKAYVNTVVLPDRTVLTTGGAMHNRADSVLTSAIFEPATETWRSVATDPVPRNYHTTALLLPDGRVVVMGGNPLDNSFELRISVYEPPYLFAPQRPGLTSAPATAAWGSTQTVTVDAPASPVQYVSLVSPMSVTHQTDTNMRLVDVPFTTNADGSLRLSMPADPDLLPPGPYMLVVQDARGVPSAARWVTVGGA